MAPTPDTRTDAQLMACLAQGQTHCLAEISRRHRDRAVRLAYRMLGRWDDAQDIAQQALVRVHRSAAQYQPQAQFTTWLHRIVVNLCHDHHRRLQRQPGPLPEVEPHLDMPPDARLQSTELAQRVAHAIAELPQRQRTALILHRYDGMSHQQIAAVTGDSTSAVESLLVRAYARLRHDLADLHNS